MLVLIATPDHQQPIISSDPLGAEEERASFDQQSAWFAATAAGIPPTAAPWLISLVSF